jgi:cob(I)alamin adenosyltransferase
MTGSCRRDRCLLAAPLNRDREQPVKIYTRKGDAGQTSIWGGRRLDKDAARVEALGSVDECNAALGAALAAGPPAEVRQVVAAAQGDLLVIGTELMAPERTGAGRTLPRLSADAVTRLEMAIDRIEAGLPELTNFILPGGTPAAAELHVARAVCRRAERRVTTLRRDSDVPPVISEYLNRLGDLLFVAARSANHAAGVSDAVWTRPA